MQFFFTGTFYFLACLVLASWMWVDIMIVRSHQHWKMRCLEAEALIERMREVKVLTYNSTPEQGCNDDCGHCGKHGKE